MDYKKQGVVAVITAALAMAGCRGSVPVKSGAFPEQKIEVSTVDEPQPHKAAITLAILPFKNNTGDANMDQLGITLADLVSVQMSANPGLRLTERARLKEILEEMKLGLTGVVDTATAVRVGRILGANVIGFGSFSKLGGKSLLSIRLVKVETAEVVGGATERTRDFSDLDRLAEKAAEKLSVALAPNR
ncbi:MAG: hypothetical protein HY747_09395 [Elusimicrobia bacterium]|nr:hypothetical protein [Elusimicrobiota bacterium]